MTQGGIDIDTATLVAVILEGILYGISLPFFGATIWALFANRQSNPPNRVMLSVSLLLLALSTTHLFINIAHIYECLIILPETYPSRGPDAFCADLSRPTFNYKNGVLVGAIAVGDALMIYRVFLVWRDYRILSGLVLLWLGVAVCGLGTEITVSRNVPVTSAILKAWIGSQWATAFICNASATACLAYRVWKVSHGADGFRVSRGLWRPLIRVVLDSAILYCTSLLITMILALSDWESGIISLDMVCPILCLSFYAIIIRIHMSVDDCYASRPRPRTTGRENIVLRDVASVLRVDRFANTTQRSTPVAKLFDDRRDDTGESM